ncbi:MAG TPA: S-adenosylmethionine:tRNA ribosyltransferase-isomerase [Sandaracinaceae bacterium LLY-WYZ-13_1]|nr:S-adenosylmethionine:tRNA ribosyltransferase-isomerase [Sandaracinaceae bacterium LLY-WYZ-13_1]
MRGAAHLPAAAEPRSPDAQRLLHVDLVERRLTHHAFDALASLARPGDAWVLNDAATLPASLAGTVGERSVELRLAGRRASGRWRAILFGEGSWRDDTDARPPPPALAPGDGIDLGAGLSAVVTAVDARAARLLEVRFEPAGDAFWRALYALGRPIQYRYLRRALTLGELQTAFAARPWAVELPSAGRPLTAARVAALRAAGAEVHTLTHAAGPSATGDATLDARLPLPERYELSEATARAVGDALDAGRRVVAVGTSVTRALEGAVRRHGRLRPGVDETDLRIGPTTERRVVDALLTGAHDPSSSHHALLRAFAPAELLRRALGESRRRGYLAHELGDSWFLA